MTIDRYIENNCQTHVPTLTVVLTASTLWNFIPIAVFYGLRCWKLPLVEQFDYTLMPHTDRGWKLRTFMNEFNFRYFYTILNKIFQSSTEIFLAYLVFSVLDRQCSDILMTKHMWASQLLISTRIYICMYVHT